MLLKNFKFKLYITFILCMGFQSLTLHAQNTKSSNFDFSKVFTGGGVGMSFGTVTVIEASPIVGYRFTEKMSAGIGGIYKYYNDKRFSPPDNRTVYGGNAFARYYVTQNIFAHLEYEYLTYKTNYFTLFGDQESISEWGLLAGGGYRQPISQKAYAYALILYNFNETKYTPYENPVIRIGVEFGL